MVRLGIIILYLYISVANGRTVNFGFTVTGGPFEKNKFSDSQVLLEKANVGPIMCVKKCILVNKCTAVNYIRKENRCLLLNNVSPSSTPQNKNGFDYTEVDRWQMNRNPCYPNQCKAQAETKECVVSNLQNFICMQLASCPASWPKLNEKCYFFSDQPMNWPSAKEYCELLASILAEPNTTDEINILKSIASSKGNTFWIGGKDSNATNDWSWATSNAKFTVTDWYRGEPTGGTDRCLNLHSPLGFKWNDSPCSDSLKFICEKKLVKGL